MGSWEDEILRATSNFYEASETPAPATNLRITSEHRSPSTAVPRNQFLAAALSPKRGPFSALNTHFKSFYGLLSTSSSSSGSSSSGSGSGSSMRVGKKIGRKDGAVVPLEKGLCRTMRKGSKERTKEKNLMKGSQARNSKKHDDDNNDDDDDDDDDNDDTLARLPGHKLPAAHNEGRLASSAL
uniref:Uncharacterized protein n=1 Tax=Vespula pensylvanica TaxID=30213 RepID=A0A834PBQ9_VESPE|nr:hypothetical protein H0235_003600 [Vespula pensylvanica]